MVNKAVRILVPVFLCLLSINICFAQTTLQSGLKPGRRPGPYTAIVSVGKERGTLHCYICEAGDRPIVIVFARSLTDSLGKLVQKIDQAVAKNEDLTGWVTFLHKNQSAFDPKVIAWGKNNAIRNVPLAIFEDLTGPPTYLLSKKADVTVLLSVNQKVQANFSFREGELNEQAINEIAKEIPKLVSQKTD